MRSKAGADRPRVPSLVDRTRFQRFLGPVFFKQLFDRLVPGVVEGNVIVQSAARAPRSEGFDLPSQEILYFPQPFQRLSRLQDGLRVDQFQVKVAGYQIGQASGVIQLGGDGYYVGMKAVSEVNNGLQTFLDTARQRVCFPFVLWFQPLVDSDNAATQKWLDLAQVPQPCPRQALDQDLGAGAPVLPRLHDLSRGTYLVKALRAWFFDRTGLLGRKKDDPVVAKCFLNREHGLTGGN